MQIAHALQTQSMQLKRRYSWIQTSSLTAALYMLPGWRF